MKKNVYTLIFIIVCLVASNNIFALDSSLKKNNKNPYNYYPHKGAFLLGVEYIGGDKIDKGFKKTVDVENNLLTAIGLTWNTLDDKGNIISTENINNYSYSGNGLTIGLRLLYFATDNLAIGGRYGNYLYSQTLTIDKKDVTGTLMGFYYLGPSINWYAFKKNRFGILLKSDFSMVIGQQETIPALSMLISDSYFSDKLPETLASSIKTTHLTSRFYGFQCNGGIGANYFFSNWFTIDAGIQFYYFTGSFNKIMLISEEKSIKSLSPVFNLSVNFLLRNKHLN
jgi:hypothetical protein